MIKKGTQDMTRIPANNDDDDDDDDDSDSPIHRTYQFDNCHVYINSWSTLMESRSIILEITHHGLLVCPLFPSNYYPSPDPLHTLLYP